MGRLDLNLLRVLDAMFTHRSVSAAARALGLTQPGLSIALKRLRTHFGDELFVRQAGVMLPTALAERLREPTARTMATIRAEILPAGKFDPGRSERSFAISLSDLGDLVFLPDLVARLRTVAPGISIRSVASEPSVLFRGMAEGTIDLAIGHLTNLDTTSFYEQTLFEQGFVCLVRKDHPTIGDALTIDLFFNAEQIVVTQEGRSQERFEKRMRDLGRERRIALLSPHFMSVPLLVAQSDMITVVPAAVGRIYARLLRLRMLPIPFDVPAVELRQFWHRRAHADPAVTWLRKIVADLFVGRDPTLSAQSPFWSRLLDKAGSSGEL
ncbi:LysR family transcriptional regulator [Sphingomonas sp. BIUV-7]|uniref:LysR family transcriptional regulator n=1 Tax=Sphingomonas natans TaxID=3063330 RepID=A0ABT8YCH5_9SPHN|nr:LysR family transcriptional regulator [Sphingomonas sp. BIUV-7]MDO6415335.1 LysR family transcriptional regulator [Sphingomonas sp. BIUV-7]